MCANKKGVSGRQIQRMLQCSMKPAWFLTNRIREAMNDNPGVFYSPLGGDGGTLLKRTAGDLRASCLSILFERGTALGWLTDILRTEIFSQGHYGDHLDPEGDRMLTAEEFTQVLGTMLNRYREAPPGELMQVPQFLSLLYAWKQGSRSDEAREWVGAQTVTDAGLLSILARVRSWRASSDTGIQYPLKRRDLESFLDFDAALKRLQAISTSGDASSADRNLALELLAAAKQDID
jgi:hypothetical protein